MTLVRRRGEVDLDGADDRPRSRAMSTRRVRALTAGTTPVSQKARASSIENGTMKLTPAPS